MEDEMVTAADLNVVLVSGSDGESEDDLAKQAVVKEEEESDNWQLLACASPSEDQPSTSALVGEEELTEHADVEPDDQAPDDDDDDEEEEEEEVVQPIPTRPRGRPLRACRLALPTRGWQNQPGPPAEKRKTSAAPSPVWEFFSVPESTNKATASKAKCTICTREVSRGQPSKTNQSRGTGNMLRHLCVHHWADMSADFQRTYWKSRCRALRLPFEDSEVQAASPADPLPVQPVCTSAITAVTTSTTSSVVAVPCDPPNQGDALAFEANRFQVVCIFCRNVVVHHRTSFDQWPAVLRAHCFLCPRDNTSSM